MPRNYHVTPNPNGGWDAKAAGARRASSTHRTQAQAEAAAKGYAANKAAVRCGFTARRRHSRLRHRVARQRSESAAGQAALGGPMPVRSEFPPVGQGGSSRRRHRDAVTRPDTGARHVIIDAGLRRTATRSSSTYSATSTRARSISRSSRIRTAITSAAWASLSENSTSAPSASIASEIAAALACRRQTRSMI